MHINSIYFLFFYLLIVILWEKNEEINPLSQIISRSADNTSFELKLDSTQGLVNSCPISFIHLLITVEGNVFMDTQINLSSKSTNPIWNPR